MTVRASGLEEGGLARLLTARAPPWLRRNALQRSVPGRVLHDSDNARCQEAPAADRLPRACDLGHRDHTTGCGHLDAPAGAGGDDLPGARRPITRIHDDLDAISSHPRNRRTRGGGMFAAGTAHVPSPAG